MRAFIAILAFAFCAAFTPWQPVINVPCCQTIPPSTWDPGVNSTACPPIPTTCITYTNSNLTWTGTNCVGVYCLARGTNNHTSGKWHVEFTITGGGGCCQAIGLTSGVTTANQQMDTGGQGAAYQTSTGQVTQGSATPLTTGMPTWTTADVICMEVDITNKQMWFNKNNAGWLGNGGTAGTPSTGSNPINFASLANFNLYPGGNAGFTNTNSYTLNISSSGLTCPISAGFLKWG